MAVTTDIVATYKSPRKIFARLLSAGIGEHQLLACLMGFCALAFVSQLPVRAREAHLTGAELNMLLGASLLALIFILPLLLYGLAFIMHLLARVFKGQGAPMHARVALFWSLLATTPLMLLHGLVSGFIGESAQEAAIGALWFIMFLWFWSTGMWQAYWSKDA